MEVMNRGVILLSLCSRWKATAIKQCKQRIGSLDWWGAWELTGPTQPLTLKIRYSFGTSRSALSELPAGVVYASGGHQLRSSESPHALPHHRTGLVSPMTGEGTQMKATARMAR